MLKEQKEPFRTILTISTGFLIIYFFSNWSVAFWIALGTSIAGLFSSFLRKWIIKLWFKLAWVLSLIIPNILLSVIFFFILTPIAFLYKWFGNKDPLMLSNHDESTFRDVDKSFDKSYFERPW